MRAPWIAYGVVVAASLVSAVGQHLVKTGADRYSGPWHGYVLSPWVQAGMASYLAVLALMSLGFRAGGSVSTLYPVYALTYVWAALIGSKIHGHAIHPIQVMGMAALVLGITLMGVGGARVVS